MIHTFGEFRLDDQERQLLRGETVVSLTSKAFDVLLLLVRNAERTVTKEEFMDTVWAGTVVEEANLADNISTLRQALGDDAREPRFIRTVPKRGYRFVAVVRRDDLVPTRVAEHPVGDPDATPPPAATRPTRLRRAVWGALLAVIVLATFVAALRTWRSDPAPQSLAVLPFKPLVASERDAAMEMGMTDALIAKLSRIEELRVRPTAAVMAYADRVVDAREVADKLGVDTILDGKIQKNGDRMRVSVQLVRGDDGSTIWADRFDERFTDIFALQDVISERVAAALRVHLSTAERQSLAVRATDDVEAYRLYLNGMHQWRSFTQEGFQSSINYHRAAIARDPDFALAWAGVARAHSVIGIYGPMPAAEAFPKAREAAAKAVALDPNSAETHTPVVAVKLFFERDWPGALRELDLMERLDPQNADQLTLRAYYHQAMGRPDLALELLEHSLAISPDWDVAQNDVLEALVEARRYTDAERESRKVIALNPRPSTPHAALGSALAAQGRYEEAIGPLETAVSRRIQSGVRHMATLAWTHGKAGRRDQALALIEEMKRDPSPWMPFSVARAYTALGDHDQVFVWLNRAEDQHFAFTWDVRNRYEFDGIRNDPRYAQFLARMRLN